MPRHLRNVLFHNTVVVSVKKRKERKKKKKKKKKDFSSLHKIEDNKHTFLNRNCNIPSDYIIFFLL